MHVKTYPFCPILLKRRDDWAYEVITYTRRGDVIVIGRYSDPKHQEDLFQYELKKRYAA